MEGGGAVGRRASPRSVGAAPSPSASTSVVRAGDVRGLLLDPRDRQWERQGVRPIRGAGGRGGRNTGGAAGMLSPFAVSFAPNLLLQQMEVTNYIIQNISCGRRDCRLRMSSFQSPRPWTMAPSASSPATPAWSSEGGGKSVAAKGDAGTRLRPGEWGTETVTSRVAHSKSRTCSTACNSRRHNRCSSHRVGNIHTSWQFLYFSLDFDFLDKCYPSRFFLTKQLIPPYEHMEFALCSGLPLSTFALRGRGWLRTSHTREVA